MNAPSFIEHLRIRGITLQAHGDRLRFHPRSAMTPELLAQLQSHKHELLSSLRPTVADDWPTDLAALADWVLLLAPDDLPAAPFEFGGPYCIVVDPCKFIASLRTDIRRGASGSRARYGALQSDLRRLRGLLLADGKHKSHAS